MVTILTILVYLSAGMYFMINANSYKIHSQSDTLTSIFKRADSLRGSITPERKWWDVLKYDLEITPDISSKSIAGLNTISYKVTEDNSNLKMQIDLQEPMIIDSIILDSGMPVDFIRDGNLWYLNIPYLETGTENSLTIYFHGKPKESRFPPWDGGWVWKSDNQGRPFVSSACQGLGASSWYPCKDHQSDEPDYGAVICISTDNTLTAVSNGRYEPAAEQTSDLIKYRWSVKNPINTYSIIPYIGNYVKVTDKYEGENGNLDIETWVLDYNSDKAGSYLIPEIKKMLEAFEHWFGPYPFYEDSYKIVEAPYPGMEHQSAVAYGNKFDLGYWGKDRSKTGWGLKWDYMIVHESAHEWFGNSITSNDIADMWIHEGFADYSETLYTEYFFGKDAANEYNKGLRSVIMNKQPVIGFYNVNKAGSPDMYAKGSNMLHSIRHSIDDDEKFRNILRGLNQQYFHKTTDTKQVEDYISQNSGFDFGKVFDQYLRNIQIPVFEYELSSDGKSVKFRYSNTVDGFNLPLTLYNSNRKLKIFPDTEWKTIGLKDGEKDLFNINLITDYYYLKVSEL